MQKITISIYLSLLSAIGFTQCDSFSDCGRNRYWSEQVCDCIPKGFEVVDVKLPMYTIRKNQKEIEVSCRLPDSLESAILLVDDKRVVPLGSSTLRNKRFIIKKGKHKFTLMKDDYFCEIHRDVREGTFNDEVYILSFDCEN